MYPDVGQGSQSGYCFERPQHREVNMKEDGYRSWKDFKSEQYRQTNTFQLCIDELAHDLYYDETNEKKAWDEEELNFDY